ncbi:hypothetical protein LTR66_013652 [Elasticomyces elasticus]|nr:hypothetical protein LTR66_013652 [Elasticomyces elasticus]
MDDLSLTTTDSMASTTTTTTTSPFLSLPSELRNQIYTLVLHSPHIPQLRRLSSRSYCSDYVLPPLSLSPSLLSVCRQTHKEATPMLYGLNAFGAHPSLLTSLPFLVTAAKPVRCPAVASLIRKWYLHVRLDTDPRFTREAVEAAFCGVAELEIEVFQAMYASCDLASGVLAMFEGVRGVGSAVVVGSIGDGRYAEWLAGAMMLGPGVVAEPFDVEGGKAVDWKLDLWTRGNR